MNQLRQKPIFFSSSSERLAGEIIFPAGRGPHPAVLLIGGTMSDTRDGDPVSDLVELPKHGMLRVIAEHLGSVGIASLRWDKRGIGASTGPNRLLHTDTLTDVDDAEQALHVLADAPEVDASRVAVLGESAGGHVASLLASRTTLPTAYVLQAALYESIPRMLAYNFNRIRQYCAQGPEYEDWVKQVAPQSYLMGSHWRKILQAARRGEEFYKAGVNGTVIHHGLRRYKVDLDYPPAEQFRYIQKPTLVIQGEWDLNVPPDNCLQIVRALRAAGNYQVTLVRVPGADHSMQLAPDDVETRIRERISFESFRNPYSQFFMHALAGWLLDKLRMMQSQAIADEG